MSPQGILCHELIRNLVCEVGFDAALCVDFGQFGTLKSGLICKFGPFAREVRLLCIRLRADGNVLPRRHGHCPGNETRNTCDEYG